MEHKWKYADYSDWSQLLAKTYTRAELERELRKASAEQSRLAASSLRAIVATHSMTSNAQRRAQSSNAAIGNWERMNAYKNALEIYDHYPEKTKDGVKPEDG